MNGSSNQMFSKSWQRPGNLAMMASIAVHGVLFAGLALVPATGQQSAKKQLRVVSLLQSPPNQPNRSNQPIDPNAPPPAPGVAGLPLNITTPDGLAELPVSNAPNPAFDPFASSVVELPPPPPQASFTPFDPNSLAAAPPSSSQSGTPTPPANNGPSLSQEDFEAWLNGNAALPGVTPDPGTSGPLPSPGVAPGPVASSTVPSNSPNVGGVENNPINLDNNSLASSSIAPPSQTVKRFLAYDYPKAACQDRLEGKAEYRIWVSSQATPVVSDIVVSTESPILDGAVKAAAQKYKIKAEDANKIVVLPFDIKYSSKACAVKATTPPGPSITTPEPSPSAPTPITPTPKPSTPSDTQPQGTNSTPPPSIPTPATPAQSQPVGQPAPALPNTPQPPVQPATPPQPPAQPATVAPPAAPVQPATPLQELPSNADLSQPSQPTTPEVAPPAEAPTAPSPADEPAPPADSPAN